MIKMKHFFSREIETLFVNTSVDKLLVVNFLQKSCLFLVKSLINFTRMKLK